MDLGSFFVLLAVFVALAIAIVFICNHGGWQGKRRVFFAFAARCAGFCCTNAGKRVY